MNSEDNEKAKADLLWQTWQDGISKAGSSAAVKLFRSGQPITDEELFQAWIETIDHIMEFIAESPADFEEWKQRNPNEKREIFEGKELNFEIFVSTIQRVINVMKTGTIDQADKKTAGKIIAGALSRAANKEVEIVVDLDPGKELMSSEKIGELGISREKLIESLLRDPQVMSADCVEGEFRVSTICGEIQFRLVFGDEPRGGKA
jgi:hypothetical protein